MKLLYVRIRVFLAVLILALFRVNAYADEVLGFDSEEFFKMKDSTLNAMHDLLQHTDYFSTPYENSLFKIVTNGDYIPNKKERLVRVKNFTVVRLMHFLGYISGINLSIGDYCHLLDSQKLIWIEKLYKFYYKKKYGLIYNYWVIYNMFYMTMEQYTWHPVFTKMLLGKSGYKQYDGEALYYAKDHPKERFSQEVFIHEDITKAFFRLNGILKLKDPH